MAVQTDAATLAYHLDELSTRGIQENAIPRITTLPIIFADNKQHYTLCLVITATMTQTLLTTLSQLTNINWGKQLPKEDDPHLRIGAIA